MAYSTQFKEEAMRLVIERLYTSAAAARELQIPVNTLRKWLRKAGWQPPAKTAKYLQSVQRDDVVAMKSCA